MNTLHHGPLVGFLCLACGVGLHIGPFAPGTAAAEAGAVLVAVEPGVANLAAAREQQPWGFFGGVSATLNVDDLVAFELHIDRKVLIGTDPEITVIAWGPSLVYEFDLQPVSPFVAVGIAGVAKLEAGERQPYAELAAVMSIGLNVRLYGRFLLGAIFRYYLVPDPAGALDFGAPGYSSINARLGFCFGDR